ncbi:MAG: ATP-binding cassette domain-containing protein [Actinomycetota bacterium]|nr:ATP-binding cassette domain-containing protein [Actinomycetota bacterium]
MRCDTALVDETLAALDLTDVADRDPFTLSGGQKQRVAVACAVASGRPVVLFDEPTSGLGLGHMLQLAEVLRELTHRGRTVVVVTHDNELIEAVADCLLVL